MFITLTVTCPNEDCEADIECAFEHGYAPTPCSDHDHPAFSDPGSPDDYEYPDECPTCHTPLLAKDMEEAIADAATRRDESLLADEYDRREGSRRWGRYGY